MWAAFTRRDPHLRVELSRWVLIASIVLFVLAVLLAMSYGPPAPGR